MGANVKRVTTIHSDDGCLANPMFLPFNVYKYKRLIVIDLCLITIMIKVTKDNYTNTLVLFCTTDSEL